MSASRQSSLLSFFSRKGAATPSENSRHRAGSSETTPRTPKTPTSTKNDNRVFKRLNFDEVEDGEEEEQSKQNIKTGSQAKRRRVLVSSDEEDFMEVEPADRKNGGNAKQDSDAEFEEDENEDVKKTPRNKAKNSAIPSSSARKRNVATKNETSEGLSTEFATSFINAFKADELDEPSAVSEAMTPARSLREIEKTVNMNSFEINTFKHESYDFLMPAKIRDAERRRPTDPDYDASTLFVPPNFIKQQTPAHQQWWMIKSQNFDTLLCFKVGKFYELFHMDAVIAVNCLSLAFMKGDYAHAGFPEYGYAKFADQLVARGYKVARIEQTETPQQLEERNKKANSKEKVVSRELCRITSSATRTFGILDAEDEPSSAITQHLIAIREKECSGKVFYGVCYIDTTIGQFAVGQFEDDEHRSALRTLLATTSIAQILLERGNVSSQTKSILTGMLSSVPVDYLTPRKQFPLPPDVVKMLQNPDYLGVEVSEWPAALRSMLRTDAVLPEPAIDFDAAWSAIGAVVGYLKRCQIDVDLVTMRDFELYEPLVNNTHSIKHSGTKSGDSSGEKRDAQWRDRRVILDGITLFNLNVMPSERVSAAADPLDAACSLYSTINRCQTPFGKRLLRQWLCAPPCGREEIEQRQTAIAWLLDSENADLRETVAEKLRNMPDLERMLQKIHTLGLKYRAEKHPDSRAVMFDTKNYSIRKIKELIATLNILGTCERVVQIYTKHEGGCPILDAILCNSEISQLGKNLEMFLKSFDQEQAAKDGRITPLHGQDELYDAACEREANAHAALEEYRAQLQKQLKCKVAYSNAQGKNRLQLEVPADTKMPNNYELKSRNKRSCRYMTAQLQELIGELEVAEGEKNKQTADATRRAFEAFDHKRWIWRSACTGIATLDVLLSFAKYAKTSGLEMCRPEFDFEAEKPYISIEDGVHPCLAARSLPSGNAYIANDTRLGGETAPLLLLTGPNAGGKSTLMRQVATLCILAHTGSLVPATSMRLTPVDRIFTRIGASDKIMCGQSTFFVELNETKLILRNATTHSLVLFDELGRGTSTFDGTAIASAVLSHLASRLACRGFFSTHYQSICSRVANSRNIAMGHMACVVENESEEDPTLESVTFLYKLTQGVCPKSYGFHAAKLAKISDDIIRASYAAACSNISTSSDAGLSALRLAARNGASLDELSRMLAAL